MNELLCVYVVYGKNQFYMPFLAYSILTAYPKYFIRFILLDELNSQVNTLLKLLKKNGLTNFNIISKRPIFFQPHYEKFLLEENWFHGFDYAWISDLNMLHFHESPTWLERELQHCEQTNLPFYNTQKNNIMSSCHFIKVKPYFQKMNNLIQEFKLSTPVDYNLHEGYLLFSLLEKAFKVDISDVPRELHGLILEDDYLLKYLSKISKNELMTEDEFCRHIIESTNPIEFRLKKAISILKSTSIPFAVVGGNAVREWMSKVDPRVAHTTNDIDLLIRPEDLERFKKVMVTNGYYHSKPDGINNAFLETEDESLESLKTGIHIILANQMYVSNEFEPNPDVEPVEYINEIPTLPLYKIVRMKLNAYRLKDQIHLLKMIQVDLINETWIAKFPEKLGVRLKSLIQRFQNNQKTFNKTNKKTKAKQNMFL